MRFLAQAAIVAVAGCSGSSSGPPAPTPTSSASAIVSGGQFIAAGSYGVTFTFTFGPGVPAGESGAVTVLPMPPQCQGTGCAAVLPPHDGFEIAVGPHPLAVSAIASVALSGVLSASKVAMSLGDTTDPVAYTNFQLLNPTGGSIVIADPASPRPILTLAPNHFYAISVYDTSILPT